ncbi:MAG: GTP-binding protein, partial [Planctomycetes bacterium]|nr:GTP-binding protein [Planctomycetota bacterium]
MLSSRPSPAATSLEGHDLMASYTTDDIRNIALVGHGTCGKTSLAEAMLFAAKATTRQGRPDDGTSILDHDDEERQRRFSIDAAMAHGPWKGREINLLDTPGYPDFIGEAIAGLEAVDLALFVVDANSGVRINTRKLWEYASRRGIPRMVVLNRLDMEHADFVGNLEGLAAAFGERCIPLTLPNGSGAGFSAVEGTFRVGEGASDRARAIHEKLLEAIIEVDDALLERYFNGEEIGGEELARTFTRS